MATSLPIPALEERAFGRRGIPLLSDDALLDACCVRIAFGGRAGGVSQECFAELNCGLHVGDDPSAVMRNRELLFDALGVAPMPVSAGDEALSCALSAGAADGGGRGVQAGELLAGAGACGGSAEAGSHVASAGARSGRAEARKPVVAYVVPSQVHGTDIVCIADASDVHAAQEASLEGADGLVVTTDRVAAMLNFADCLPLVIVSPDGSFAVAHAGWRGAVAGIASKAARELARASGCAAGDFNAYIGPHICGRCFEVGVDVAERFAAAYGQGVLLDARHVSLAEAVTRDLQSAGVDHARIADAHACTKCDPERYFSYRASQGRCGRHAAVAFRAC